MGQQKAEFTEEYRQLYEHQWRIQSTLLEDRYIGPYLLPFATPVPAFGSWQTAKIATAGLNPSRGEFCDPSGNELVATRRRLVHRVKSKEAPTETELMEGMRLANAYFTGGRAYDWFNSYQPLLRVLGWTFMSGDACHTDYISPFATIDGLGDNGEIEIALREAGGPAAWKQMLELMPRLQAVLGMGQGWRYIPRLLGFPEWEPIETRFDSKGGRANIQKPYLLYSATTISGRSVHVFWWRPYRGDALSWLNRDDKEELGYLIKFRLDA